MALIFSYFCYISLHFVLFHFSQQHDVVDSISFCSKLSKHYFITMKFTFFSNALIIFLFFNGLFNLWQGFFRTFCLYPMQSQNSTDIFVLFKYFVVFLTSSHRFPAFITLFIFPVVFPPDLSDAEKGYFSKQVTLSILYVKLQILLIFLNLWHAFLRTFSTFALLFLILLILSEFLQHIFPQDVNIISFHFTNSILFFVLLSIFAVFMSLFKNSMVFFVLFYSPFWLGSPNICC